MEEYGEYLKHKPAYIAIINFTCAVFVLTVIFNIFAGGVYVNNDLFHNSTGDVSNSYATDITPAGWTFSLWVVIYIWQGLWLVYSLSTICRKTSYGYLYVNPCHQPPMFYVAYIFNLATNIGWLFLWDRFYPQYALIFLPLTAFSLYICLGISCKKLYNISPVFIREEAQKDIWLTRILTQNGLAIYAAWASLATLLNFDIVLIEFAHMSPKIAGTVYLVIVNLEIVTWFILDNFILDRFVRYILTPYLVFIIGIAGSLDKNWNSSTSNSALVAFTLALAILAAVLKIISLFYKHVKHPLFGNGTTGLSVYNRQTDYGTLGEDKDYNSFMD